MQGGSISTGGVTTAGNYPDYTQYCTPIDRKQFEEVFWCNSLFEGVGSGGMLNGLTELGQTARFWTRGRPNIYSYVKNGAMEFDNLSACPVDYKLDTIRYSAMKYDVTDEGNCMMPMMRKAWQEDVPKVHSEKFDQTLLCTLPSEAAACTQGNAAGATHDLKLGTISAPTLITARSGVLAPAGAVSVFEYMTRGIQAMSSYRIPTNNNVISFIPDALRFMMMNSDLMNNAQLNGQGVAWLGTMMNGACDGLSLRCGHEVRASQCIQQVGTFDVAGVTKPVYRVLWLWKPGFSAINKSYRMLNGEYAGTPMGRLDVRMTISGAAVQRREGIAVGYVVIAD
jgi:hypothetical protein